MLRFEAVLAEAQAQKSIIPKIVSESIGSTCEVDLIDVPSLKEAIKLGGNAAIPLVRQLTQLVKSRDAEAAKYVHLGVTSQDLIDTASVLQIQEYLF